MRVGFRAIVACDNTVFGKTILVRYVGDFEIVNGDKIVMSVSTSIIFRRQ